MAKMTDGNIKCQWGCRKTGSHIPSQWEYKIIQFEKIFRVPYKVKLHQCCYPEIPLLGNSPKEIKTYVLKKSSYTFSQEKSRETKYDTFTWLNTAQK